MSAWIAWAFSLAGFAAFSVAMERHQEAVLGHTLSSFGALSARLAGIGLLALSLVVCAFAWRWSVAVVAWLGVLSFAATSVGISLTYLPRQLPFMAVAMALLGVVGHLLQ